MRNLRIFIAESDPDVSISLQMMMDREPGMQVVGIAVRSNSLVGQVGAAQPDIVLLDWQLVRSSPADIIENLHSLTSKPQVIVLNIRSETKPTVETAAADYFICKDRPADDLCAILQKLRRGKAA